MTAFKGRGLIQLTGQNMSTLLKQSTNMNNMTLGAAKMAIASQGVYSAEAEYGQKISPKKKISFDVHDANGGYIIEVNGDHHSAGELYIVGEEKNIGEEIGKIITHYKLKA